MGTAQMVRNQAKTVSWSSIFPPEQVTEQQSALFVKKLLAVAVSSITYLRAIFPEHAFGDRRLEDLNLKILKDDSTCPGACQVIQWIKGCFDALDKKYLKMIVIGIYMDADDPETVIESYTFKFTYNKDGMSIFRNGNKIASAYTEAETKKATIRLLRTIIILTQTLTSLPDDVIMSMKLLYYDEVTPPYYQPPGFKETGSDCFQFAEEPMNIKVGDVSTPFHTVKLRIKTELHQFELKEDEDPDAETDDKEVVRKARIEGNRTETVQEEGVEQAMEDDDSQLQPGRDGSQLEADNTMMASPHFDVLEDHAPPATPTERRTQRPDDDSQQIVPGSATGMEYDEVPVENPNTPGLGESAEGFNTRASTPRSTASQEMIHNDDEEVKVDCSCGYNEDDGLMIMCGVCNTWQHAVCYGLLEEDEAPQFHVCAGCSKNENPPKCTDPSLQELSPVVLQATCLWRRALMACSEMSRILPTSLSRRLGIDMSVAQGLVKRLEKEGFVRSALKGKRLGKIVNKAKLKAHELKQYISKTKDATQQVNSTQEEGPARDEVQAVGNKEKEPSIDSITEKASMMDVSGGLRTKKTKESDRLPDPTADTRKTRSAKRAISTLDKEQEFDISDSQEPAEDRDAPVRKRKASISTKAILV